MVASTHPPHVLPLTQAPASQACWPEHTWQVPPLAPHAKEVLDGVMQVPFGAQQPAQVNAQLPASAPGLTQAPAWQLWVEPQAAHAPPPVPHTSAVSPEWQMPFAQHPPQLLGLQAAPVC